MKKRPVLFFCLFIVLASPLQAYKLMFAEEYYQLYHRHFYTYPENCNENIFYLERALAAPFCNPLFAMAKINTAQEWERYRYLFYLHVNLKIVEQYRHLAAKYDKFEAFFYNYPWREQNLKSLRYAEDYYEIALYYWDEALSWAAKLEETPYFHLPEIQFWEDEYYRIKTGDLDYLEFISSDLDRLRSVRAAFEDMGPETY